jgi:hypothetical protein
MAEPRIDWVSGKPSKAVTEYSLWRSAVEQADGNDLQPLTELLRSDHIPGPESRLLIADLLSRHTLRKKRGRQAVPAYRQTLSQAVLNDGAAHYRYHRRKKVPAPEAMEMAAEDAGIGDGDFEKFAMHVGGRLGASNRVKKRRVKS